MHALARRLLDAGHDFLRREDFDAETLRLKHRAPYLLEAMKHYAWFPVHIPTIDKHGGLAKRGRSSVGTPGACPRSGGATRAAGA